MRPIGAHALSTGLAPARHSRGTHARSIASDSLPDMTPMVDVVMVILIFFMTSTALVGPELLLRARVAPDTRQNPADAPLIAPAALIIRLEPSPTDFAAPTALASGLGLTGVPAPDMIARINSRAADLRAGDIPIIIQSDPRVDYQSVVDIIAALERAGVRDIALR